jgi:site-specific DNA-methyltransferase (adenine-specific)
MPDGAVGGKVATGIGHHEIISGNCLDVLASRISPSSIDVVVTSPPYNLSLAYSQYDDTKTEAEYLAWLVSVAEGLKKVLKPSGSFFLNISGSNSKPWIPFEVIVRLRHAGFSLQNHITWIKSITIESASSGHFKPIPGKRFMHHNHEHIFHLTLNNDVQLDRLAIGIPFQDKTNIARRGHPRDLRCRGNTWFIPYPTVKTRAQKYWHPGTFPVELPLWCIHLHGQRNAVVLDPFMGTGTTLVAAHYAGATGIGIDVDAAYIATAHQRVTEAVESSMLVILSQAEMSELFKQDAAGREGGGWQRKIVSFQERLNKTSGELSLTADDIDWIKNHASHPGQGSWQRWVNAALGKHIDLAALP